MSAWERHRAGDGMRTWHSFGDMAPIGWNAYQARRWDGFTDKDMMRGLWHGAAESRLRRDLHAVAAVEALVRWAHERPNLSRGPFR